MNLTIAFWNARGAEPTLLEAAREIVDGLIVEHQVDLVALVEVAPGAVPFTSRDGWSTHESTGDAGRGRWDGALVWNDTTVTVDKTVDTTARDGSRTLRIGLDTSLRLGAHKLRLVLAHWPTSTPGAVSRIVYAGRLRQLVAPDGILEQATLILGDFNDEPFEAGVAEALRSTRDRSLAARRPNLLYNLAWRWMGTFGETGTAGTYHYPGGPATSWHTFDHVLVSHHLLRDGAAVMLANDTVVESVGGTSVVSRGFDHLPIITVLKVASGSTTEVVDG